MKIVLKSTPRTVTAKTKRELMSKLKLSYTSSSTRNSKFSGYKQYDKLVGINFEKHRKKVLEVKKSKKARNGEKRVMQDSYWIAYVYTFDKDLFDTLGMELQQHTRNFTLKYKKSI